MTEIAFDEYQTRYHGKRERCAVLTMDGTEVRLKMGPTVQCAQSVERSRSLLRRVAEQLDLNPNAAEQEALALTTHCRALTGWKDKPKRDIPRQRVMPRRFYL